MAFKIKHIASRFLIQSIFTLLIICILFLIFFYSTNRQKDSLRAVEKNEAINNFKKQISSHIDNAAILHKSNSNFVSQTADNLILESDIFISNFQDTINQLSRIKFLSKYLENESIIDTLMLNLNLWSTTFEHYVLSLKQLGNRNGGAIKEITSAINALSGELYNAPDSGVQFSSLRKLSSEFLVSFSEESLDELIKFCNEVSGEFYSFDDYDPMTLGQLTVQASEKLLACKTIMERLINESDNSGFLPELELSTNNLFLRTKELSETVHNKIDRYRNWWKLVFLVIAIILLTSYVILMYLFSGKVRRDIRLVNSESKQISSGNYVIETNYGGAFEFEDIFTNLREIKAYLNERNEIIRRLLENDFEMSIQTKSDDDELSYNLNALKNRMLKEQELQLEQNEHNEVRRYLNEGLAKFSDILRVNSNNTILLGDNLIKELVKYLDALQGGLFLTNEHDNNLLNLISAFAFDRKKYLNKTVEKGQGLVGTCALEKKTIHITEVPEDYISIKSGLGDAPPNNILIVPVMHELNLVGVLEIASLKLIGENEIDLTQQIASSLASTIITVRNNTKTAQLLEKSQQQAAEMREQEEEMRQNMEELKATQEESTRREEEMQGLIDAVGTGFYLIEYNTNGEIENVNTRLSAFLEQPLDSIVGSKHRDVFSKDSIIDNEVFENLLNTKSTKKLTEFLPWGSKELVYYHTLSPILSREGEVTRILNLLTIEEKQNK